MTRHPKQSRLWWDKVFSYKECDEVLAQRNQVSQSAVAHERRRRGMKAVKKKKESDMFDWESVDWTQSDRAIARETAFSHTTIRVKRAAQEPPPEPTFLECLTQAMECENEDGNPALVGPNRTKLHKLIKAIRKELSE